MLETILADKKEEIARLQAERRHGSFQIHQGIRPPFSASLLRKGPGAVIAEFKPASPSKGAFTSALLPTERALAYRDGGAAAISVLTEEKHFGSSLGNLRSMQQAGLPLLRKDFLIDPVQIEQTAATPASALLLIARLFADRPDRLAELIRLCRQYSLEPVVEIFEGSELEIVRQAGADIIQVNNRDLSTMRIDLKRSRELIMEKRPGELWICASGLKTAGQVRDMASRGYAACLIGTSLMQSPDPAAMLKDLTQGEHGTCSGKSAA